jgi:hypothetical protein
MRTTDGSFVLDLGAATVPDPIEIKGVGFISEGDTTSTPVIGNWSGQHDLPGYFRRGRDTQFVLYKSLDPHEEPFIAGGFEIPDGRSIPFPSVGDWNNDGVADIGIFLDLRPTGKGGQVQLLVKDPEDWSYSRFSEFEVNLQMNDTCVIGNWEGRGDRFGLFRPNKDMFHLFVNNNQDVVQVGGISANGNESPLSGDWNGDGKDESGFFRPPIPEHVLPEFHLFPEATSISTFREVKGEGFGGNPDEIPLVGKWDEKYWN